MDNYNKGENSPKKTNLKGPKIPFNLYWVYLIVFAAIIGMYFFSDNTVTKEVPWSDFQGYVKNNSVNKIIVDRKNSTLKAFVRPDSVKSVFKGEADRAGTNPGISVAL